MKPKTLLLLLNVFNILDIITTIGVSYKFGLDYEKNPFVVYALSISIWMFIIPKFLIILLSSYATYKMAVIETNHKSKRTYIISMYVGAAMFLFAFTMNIYTFAILSYS